MIREVPGDGHLVFMMDAHARTGRRGNGCSDAKVLGVYGRATLNENRERVLDFAGDNERFIAYKFFCTSKRGASPTSQ